MYGVLPAHHNCHGLMVSKILSFQLALLAWPVRRGILRTRRFWYLQILRRRGDPSHMGRQGDKAQWLLGTGLRKFDNLTTHRPSLPSQLIALECTAMIKYPKPADERWIYSILVECCSSALRFL